MESMQSLALSAALLLAAVTDPDAAFKAGDFETARQGYELDLRAHPHDPAALVRLATIELYDNDLNRAREHVGVALRMDPSSDPAKRLQRTLSQRIGEIGGFTISRQGEAVLPFVAEAPLPVVRMRINGADARVVVDTGAPGIVLTEAFARRHGLEVRDAGEGIFAGGKRARIRETTIREISAGSIRIANASAGVFGGPPQSEPIDAVVGAAFFTRFLTTIDYPRHRLILRSPQSSPPQKVISRVPMWLVGDHFIFTRASVNDAEPGLFMVDSGAQFGVSLTRAALDAAHITPDADRAETFLGGGGETRILPFTVTSLAIGDARGTDVAGAFFPDGDPYGRFPFTIAGTVSGGFLRHYAVTFDFRAMRLSLAR
jgi:predicted aspartyl protease